MMRFMCIHPWLNGLIKTVLSFQATQCITLRGKGSAKIHGNGRGPKQYRRHFWSELCLGPSILSMLQLKRERTTMLNRPVTESSVSGDRFSSSKEIHHWRHAAHSNTDLRAIFQLCDFNRPPPLSLARAIRPPVTVLFTVVCMVQTVCGAAIRGCATTTC